MLADSPVAVARGAVYYGLSVRGRGVRIRGGVARSHHNVALVLAEKSVRVSHPIRSDMKE